MIVEEVHGTVEVHGVVHQVIGTLSSSYSSTGSRTIVGDIVWIVIIELVY